jgi:hypothetical protein
VTALHVHDDGSGEALYIAGRLLHPSIPRTGNPILVRWNGVSVTHVADADAPVEDMVTYDDGTGPKLVVTGHFSSIGGVAANGIAAWDGGTWSPLGHGLLDIFGSPTGDALVVLSDPSGDILFAGGEIFTAGGQFRAGVVQWDGNAWSLTGTILYNGNHPRGVAYVRSLVLFDTGFGPQVHVSGSFDAPVIGIGRWDGTAWRSLGAGYQYSGSTCVVHDDGAGPALYVPAWQIDGLEVCSAARWSCPPRPTPLVRQDTPGYGSRVWLDNSGLTPGAEYYNVISTELCAGPLPGSGPLLGLCASDPAVLMAQVLTPVGTPPFHFIAPTSRSTFGPYTLPPVQVECLLMEWRFGVLWQISDIQRASVQ